MAHKNTSLYTFGSIDEDINEDACISYCKAENDENNKVASFSFKSNNKNLTNNTNSKTKTIKKDSNKPSDIIHDNRNNKFANGITPPINGESLNIRRTYLLRASTIKKINELVACNPDINVYVSTIVDKAIAHYYNYITKEGGSQQ